MLTINYRRLRAEQLMHHVLHEIEEFLPSDARREVSRRLFDLFHLTGAYIVTDTDRAAAGCPMRGVDGLTLEELAIIERHLQRSMMRSFKMPPSNTVFMRDADGSLTFKVIQEKNGGTK